MTITQAQGFTQLSQIRGKVCDNNGVSVHPYGHSLQDKVLHTVYMHTM
jgi:hypothetical protein